MHGSMIRWKLLFALSLVAASWSTVAAQEGGVKWRTDYNAARKEAETKNLPLLIDFIKTGCPPCDKMERQTFSDPRVLKTLNEKFIPLRLNGPLEPELTAKLGIDAYPTTVLAGPSGRITQTVVGFQEADALHENLQRLLATLTPTDTLKRDFENAQKWEATGEYPRAIATLRDIIDDGKSGPMQKSAQELLQIIEKRSAAQLAQAKDLQDNGKSAEALESLTDVLQKYPGLQASKSASEMIGKLLQSNARLKVDQRNKRAVELLTQARDFYKTKDYIPCLDRCKILVSNYGDMPEGQQAFALAAEIKNNPEWLQSAADVMADDLGGIYLALADSYLKRGEVQRAEFYLKRVVQAFPGSRLAESAQIRLAQLKATTPGTSGPLSAGP